MVQYTIKQDVGHLLALLIRQHYGPLHNKTKWDQSLKNGPLWYELDRKRYTHIFKLSSGAICGQAHNKSMCGPWHNKTMHGPQHSNMCPKPEKWLSLSGPRLTKKLIYIFKLCMGAAIWEGGKFICCINIWANK